MDVGRVEQSLRVVQTGLPPVLRISRIARLLEDLPPALLQMGRPTREAGPSPPSEATNRRLEQFCYEL